MLQRTINLLMLTTFFCVMWVFSKIVRAGVNAFGFYFAAVSHGGAVHGRLPLRPQTSHEKTVMRSLSACKSRHQNAKSDDRGISRKFYPSPRRVESPNGTIAPRKPAVLVAVEFY